MKKTQNTPSIASLNSLEANYQTSTRKALMKAAPKKNPAAVGAIAEIFRKSRKSYAVVASACWREDGLWIEGTIGPNHFEALADYNEGGDIVVNHLCTWRNKNSTPAG